jgi:hypothetical protein
VLLPLAAPIGGIRKLARQERREHPHSKKRTGGGAMMTGLMGKQISRRCHQYVLWLWVVGLLGFSANAQTPPTPVTKYDGIYAFVSLALVNNTYWTTRTDHVGQCARIRKVTALTISNGHAQYSTTRRYGNLNEGTVGPKGDLQTRLEPTPAPTAAGVEPGIEIITSGKIGEDGTIYARRTAVFCRYDLIWRKVSK